MYRYRTVEDFMRASLVAIWMMLGCVAPALASDPDANKQPAARDRARACPGAEAGTCTRRAEIGFVLA